MNGRFAAGLSNRATPPTASRPARLRRLRWRRIGTTRPRAQDWMRGLSVEPCAVERRTSDWPFDGLRLLAPSPCLRLASSRCRLKAPTRFFSVPLACSPLPLARSAAFAASCLASPSSFRALPSASMRSLPTSLPTPSFSLPPCSSAVPSLRLLSLLMAILLFVECRPSIEQGPYQAEKRQKRPQGPSLPT